MEYRKNMTMRIGVITAVIALITLVGISGTFAKYTTGAGYTDSQTARVAKWGVTAETDLGGLFKNAYDNGDDIIVKGAGGALVMAPGTSGKVTFLKIAAGTPEVAFKTSFSKTGNAALTGWTTDSADFYFPVSLKINGVEMPNDARVSATAAATWIDNQLSNATGTIYLPGEEITQEIDISIEWNWAFSGDDFGQTDAKDTILGSASTLPVITIPAFTAKAEQVISWE